MHLPDPEEYIARMEDEFGDDMIMRRVVRNHGKQMLSDIATCDPAAVERLAFADALVRYGMYE